MAAAIPYIITAVGTLAQMSAAKSEGDAAYETAKMRAAQDREQSRLEAMMLEREAGDDRATSQRAAEEARRVSRIRQSRAMAVAAASGAGAADPDVINIVGGLAAEGDYSAEVELYKGEDSAKYKEWRANVARVTGENSARMTMYQGKAAKSASRISAVGTLAKGAASMYGNYAGSGSGGTVIPANDDMDYGSSTTATRNWWEN